MQEIHRKLRKITLEFITEIPNITLDQAFLLGSACGFMLQHNQQDYVQSLIETIRSAKQLVQSNIVKRDYVDQIISSILENLIDIPQRDFQIQTPPIMSPLNRSVDQKTMELIKQLQEEDEKEASKIREQDSGDCGICLVPLMESEFVPLDQCIHAYHVECLKGYLFSAIQEKRKFLICPDKDCKFELSRSDLLTIIGENKLKEFENYSLKQFIEDHGDDMSWCPTPDCKYAFVYDDEMEFGCPVCKKHYCMACRVPFHKGQTCKEYQITHTKDANDIKFEKFVKGHKFKMCTQCKFWVEKNQGCNHMRCRCGYEFCYACGGKYMQCECVQKQREEAQARLQRIQEQRQLQKRTRGKKKK